MSSVMLLLLLALTQVVEFPCISALRCPSKFIRQQELFIFVAGILINVSCFLFRS